jgi:hypothetical protein
MRLRKIFGKGASEQYCSAFSQGRGWNFFPTGSGRRSRDHVRHPNLGPLAQAIVDTVAEPMVMPYSYLRVITTSRSFYLTSWVDRQNTQGRPAVRLARGSIEHCGVQDAPGKSPARARGVEWYEVEPRARAGNVLVEGHSHPGRIPSHPPGSEMCRHTCSEAVAWTSNILPKANRAARGQAFRSESFSGPSTFQCM